MKLPTHRPGGPFSYKLAALWLALAAAGAQAGQLTAYSSAGADVLKIYADQFAKSHPSIKVNWVRDSTGILQAKLMAEKDNPRADVVFGHTAANLVLLGQSGMLTSYAPKGIERLNPLYLEKRNPPQWVGMYGWASAICFNTVEAKKAAVPKPIRWTDLTQAAYRGKIIMPNPASSGTGLLMVNAWIQMWGEEKAWAYMDKLHDNIASYSHSGDKPCEQAGAGEVVVGLSLPVRGAKVKSAGAPIDVIIADEGTGWDMQAAGILKGSKNMDDAKLLLDWSISTEAMEAYGRNSEVTAVPVKVPKMENIPGNIAEKMIKVDFDWVAKDQSRVVAEWRKRYENKSEPKK